MVPLYCTMGKYSHTLVLVGFRNHQTLYSSHFDKKKMFQHTAHARDALARTCMSHKVTPQEKMLHHLVLISSGTSQEFWIES